MRSDRLLSKATPNYFLHVPKIEDNKKMEFPKEFILTSYNLFTWKEKMIMHLRSRGFYRLNMNTKTKPTSDIVGP